jgi:hypothetical protein
MQHFGSRNPRATIILSMGIGLIAFLIVYLGWSLNDSSLRYAHALSLSERRAHTTLGKEGYEYIFEPSTHILVDKIKPTNRSVIIFYIFRKDYLPFQGGSECTFRDVDICNWMDIQVFYGHDPTPARREAMLYGTIVGLVFAGGFFLLTSLVKR